MTTKRFLIQDTDSQVHHGDGHVIRAASMKQARAIHAEHFGCTIFRVRELDSAEFAGTKGMTFEDC